MTTPLQRAALVTAIAAVLAASSAYAQSSVGLDHRPAHVASGASGVPLTAASHAAPESIVAGYLQSRGRGAEVLASLRVTATTVAANGVTHVRLEQQVDGLVVYGAYVKAAVDARGELVQVIERVSVVTLVQPSRIDAGQALAATLTRLYPSQAAGHALAGIKGNTTTFAGGAFFYRDPSVTAVVLPLENGTLARGWVVETWTASTNQLHYTVVDGDGRVLEVESRTNNDSYNVFTEDPLKGSQTVVSGPGAGNTESPSGWLSGSETTVYLRGNNVNAYLDTDANNAPDAGGTSVTTGNLTTAVDLNAQPSTPGNKAVAAQNLFYFNNVMHDRLYAFGFNESNGNFQVNNFGKGGAGNDPVNAEAQDGSGTDNANFATPADGSSPRMQMYVWNSNPSGQVTVNTSSYPVYPSAFGAALTTTGLSGPLAVTSASITADDACSALPAGSLTGKVALVNRGTCNFTTKVLNAQNAGAKAVLIANNDANGAFGPGGSDRKVKIPSGMVTQADGNLLRGAVSSTALLRKITALQLDGDLDADIVFHEYGHGLTWRMIGSMSGPLAGAIGEGASDVNAFLSNGDDIMGEYAYNSPGGIRRYPYQGYPLTYKDVTGAEVHDDGEIYAAAMWKVRTNYLAAGLAINDVYGDFVDGMNYTPAAPSFEKMRDGMLQSISNNALIGAASKAARTCAVWQGFASQGVGLGASGTVSRRGTVTIVQSFTVPSGVCP
jgi:Zinc metalloprotease (elastase)